MSVDIGSRRHPDPKYAVSTVVELVALDDADMDEIEMPAYPVASLRGAFEESILESTEDSDIPVASTEADAGVRRLQMLNSPTFDDSWTSRWNQRPTARHHPLLKLMAQIVFGMHLLQQQQAKSDKEVVKILQTHVNEVDTFLERTAEDFDFATKDIEDRMRHLRLPMTHVDVFESMLDDKTFRMQLLVGNEKIEKIVERSTRAMNASLLDVDKGVQATKELHRYMKNVQDRWPREQRSIADVLEAMRGNEQGWRRYLRDLQHKANNLAKLLSALQELIVEMSGMAAAASRRNKAQSSTIVGEPKPIPTSPDPRSRFSEEHARPVELPTSPPRFSQRRTSNLNKPLPVEPQTMANPRQSSPTKPHPIPFAERYERPRQSPPEPATPPRISIEPPALRQRPKTASAATKQARAADARVNASELLSFFQRPDPLGSNPNSVQSSPNPNLWASSPNPLGSNPNPLRSNPNPLRSNPPDETSLSSSEYRLGRSQSHGINIAMDPASFGSGMGTVTRSRSQGTLEGLGVQQQGTISNSTAPLSPAPPSLNEFASAQGPSVEHAQRRAAMKNTGFARRLSKRLKHIPHALDSSAPKTPDTTTTTIKTPVPTTSRTSTANRTTGTNTANTALKHRGPPSPPDSAYASLTEKGSPPNGIQAFPVTTTTTAHNNNALSPSTGTGTTDGSGTRPESVIGPLPFANPDFSPSYFHPSSFQHQHQHQQHQSNDSGFSSRASDSSAGAETSRGGGVAASVRSLASGKSRAMSFRSAFAWKWKKGKSVNGSGNAGVTTAAAAAA